uniref:Uncharacterized protein n=1 Tax=Cacopsylla melanoneura TaxID=428564 RepID=A0A8D8QX27_9HEMI
MCFITIAISSEDFLFFKTSIIVFFTSYFCSSNFIVVFHTDSLSYLLNDVLNELSLCALIILDTRLVTTQLVEDVQQEPGTSETDDEYLERRLHSVYVRMVKLILLLNAQVHPIHGPYKRP